MTSFNRKQILPDLSFIDVESSAKKTIYDSTTASTLDKTFKNKSCFTTFSHFTHPNEISFNSPRLSRDSLPTTPRDFFNTKGDIISKRTITPIDTNTKRRASYRFSAISTRNVNISQHIGRCSTTTLTSLPRLCIPDGNRNDFNFCSETRVSRNIQSLAIMEFTTSLDNQFVNCSDSRGYLHQNLSTVSSSQRNSYMKIATQSNTNQPLHTYISSTGTSCCVSVVSSPTNRTRSSIHQLDIEIFKEPISTQDNALFVLNESIKRLSKSSPREIVRSSKSSCHQSLELGSKCLDLCQQNFMAEQQHIRNSINNDSLLKVHSIYGPSNNEQGRASLKTYVPNVRAQISSDRPQEDGDLISVRSCLFTSQPIEIKSGTCQEYSLSGVDTIQSPRGYSGVVFASTTSTYPGSAEQQLDSQVNQNASEVGDSGLTGSTQSRSTLQMSAADSREDIFKTQYSEVILNSYQNISNVESHISSFTNGADSESSTLVKSIQRGYNTPQYNNSYKPRFSPESNVSTNESITAHSIPTSPRYGSLSTPPHYFNNSDSTEDKSASEQSIRTCYLRKVLESYGDVRPTHNYNTIDTSIEFTPNTDQFSSADLSTTAGESQYSPYISVNQNLDNNGVKYESAQNINSYYQQYGAYCQGVSALDLIARSKDNMSQQSYSDSTDLPDCRESALNYNINPNWQTHSRTNISTSIPTAFDEMTLRPVAESDSSLSLAKLSENSQKWAAYEDSAGSTWLPGTRTEFSTHTVSIPIQSECDDSSYTTVSCNQDLSEDMMQKTNPSVSKNENSVRFEIPDIDSLPLVKPIIPESPEAPTPIQIEVPLATAPPKPRRRSRKANNLNVQANPDGTQNSPSSNSKCANSSLRKGVTDTIDSTRTVVAPAGEVNMRFLNLRTRAPLVLIGKSMVQVPPGTIISKYRAPQSYTVDPSLVAEHEEYNKELGFEPGSEEDSTVLSRHLIAGKSLKNAAPIPPRDLNLMSVNRGPLRAQSKRFALLKRYPTDTEIALMANEALPERINIQKSIWGPDWFYKKPGFAAMRMREIALENNQPLWGLNSEDFLQDPDVYFVPSTVQFKTSPRDSIDTNQPTTKNDLFQRFANPEFYEFHDNKDSNTNIAAELRAQLENFDEDVKCSASPSREYALPQEVVIHEFNLLKQLRDIVQAPVDYIGCNTLGDSSGPKEDYEFQVLFGAMLSPQTKDKKTRETFMKVKSEVGTITIDNILALGKEKLGTLIKGVYYGNKKCVDIIKTCELLKSEYNSRVPSDSTLLCKLPGVGPKMAYLVLQTAFNTVRGICVDTHVHKISNKLSWVVLANKAAAHGFACKPQPLECPDRLPNTELPKALYSRNPEATRILLEERLPRALWGRVNSVLVGIGQLTAEAAGYEKLMAAVHSFRFSAELQKQLEVILSILREVPDKPGSSNS